MHIAIPCAANLLEKEKGRWGHGHDAGVCDRDAPHYQGIPRNQGKR